MRKIKTCFFLLLLIVIAGAMTASVIIKDITVDNLYEDVTFTQISMEANQYISNIEYGIKYGKELNNFYDMDNTLTEISQSSSYIESAYIVSSDRVLLYQSGVKTTNDTLQIPEKTGQSTGKTYRVYTADNRYYLVMPIENGSGAYAGYLILRISKDAISNSVTENYRQNIIQSALIGLEIIGLALFIIHRSKPKKKAWRAFSLLKTISVMLICALLLDSAVTVVRYYQIANDVSAQTVDKVVQVLKSDVDQIKEEGVSSDQIYDLNGWLEKSKTEMPMVSSLYANKNNEITATVSQSYVNSFLQQSLFRMSLLAAGCLLLCILALLICGIVTRRFENKRKVLQNAAG